MNWFPIRAVIKTGLLGGLAVWLMLTAVRRSSQLKSYDRIIRLIGAIVIAGLFVICILVILGKF